MLNPSRPVVLCLAIVALAGLVLGLATDVGLFGWSLAALLALYLVVAAVARRPPALPFRWDAGVSVPRRYDLVLDQRVTRTAAV